MDGAHQEGLLRALSPDFGRRLLCLQPFETLTRRWYETADEVVQYMGPYPRHGVFGSICREQMYLFSTKIVVKKVFKVVNRKIKSNTR
jgi:hypothetical protein